MSVREASPLYIRTRVQARNRQPSGRVDLLESQTRPIVTNEEMGSTARRVSVHDCAQTWRSEYCISRQPVRDLETNLSDKAEEYDYMNKM